MRGLRKSWTALALVAIAGGGAIAQPNLPLAEKLQLREASSNPVMTAQLRGIRDEKNRRELLLRQFDARLRLHGGLVETVLEMHFAGLPGSEDELEGQLHVDLPPGAIVTGYALDVDGRMIDGSLVEAPKARAAYERQVRGRIDPGLGEVDRKGGFNVRVYPIDADKGRRIRLSFVAPAGPKFDLPLNLAANTGSWSVRVEGLGKGSAAWLGSRHLDIGDSLAERGGKGALRGSIRIEPGAEPNVASRHPLTGETFWQVGGELPPRSEEGGGTLRVYWDRSRSQKDADHRAALTRVRQAVAALSPERIELVAFNSQGAQRIDVSNVGDLADAVGGLRYAGASSLVPLVADGPASTCLLVSDGRISIEPVDLALPCRLFAIASGEQADRAMLSAEAERHGGRLIEAGGGEIDWRAPTVERVIDAAGRPLEFALLDTMPGRYRLALANPSGGPVRVVIGGQPLAVAVPPTTAEFGGEGAFLASRRVASLQGDGDRAAFVVLSRRYSIASPTLSFLVLEDPDDYVEADVEPTAAYPRLAEYKAARAEADREEAEERSDRFDELLRDWQGEVEWWERKFDPKARPGKPERSDRRTAVPAPPPPPPAIAPSAPLPDVRDEPPSPPPPPPPEPERGRDEQSTPVNVTASDAVELRQSNVAEEMSAIDADAGDIVVTANRIPDRPDISIATPAWRPERDYLNAFDRNPQQFDRIFLEWEGKAGGVPAFYLDTADWLMGQGRRDRAVETLLSALDLPSADSTTIGLVAARLQRWGMHDLAIQLRERQMLLESHRPQIKRLLALAVAARAKVNPASARADLERAIGLLSEVALEPVDDRWEGIDVIALREANALIPRLRELGGETSLDPRLIRNLDADLRIVIDWSADAIDLDLWVDEPNGERAIYSNPLTAIGGRMSNDMTAGYGPEEYWLRRAPAGSYTIQTNRFASDRLDPNGRPRLNARLIRDFGRPSEREEAIDLEMETGDEESVPIGTVKVGR
jgi:hypothetical protein